MPSGFVNERGGGMIEKYAAIHYHKRLEAALEVVSDILYELRLLDLEWAYMNVDEDEPALTLHKLERLAKEET